MDFCSSHKSPYLVLEGLGPPKFLSNALVRVQILQRGSSSILDMSVGALVCHDF